MLLSKPKRIKYGLLTFSALFLTLALWDPHGGVQAVQLASALQKKKRRCSVNDDESEDECDDESEDVCDEECEDDCDEGVVYLKKKPSCKKKKKKHPKKRRCSSPKGIPQFYPMPFIASAPAPCCDEEPAPRKKRRKKCKK